MITVFFGSPRGAEKVRRACADHAAWLRRPVRDVGCESAAGSSVYAAWDPATTDDQYRYLAVCLEAGCHYDGRLDGISPRVTFHLHPADGRLRVEAPIGSTVQLQHARVADGWLLTDDIRLLRRVSEPSLDPIGVFALLKFGAIPAPFTTFEGVTRVAPGTALVHDASAGRTEEEHPWRDAVAQLPRRPRAASLEEAREMVIGAIDRALQPLPEGGSVLFSGGTDSTIIAARLTALGRDDVQLAHLRFTYLPEETRVAQALADHLRLPMRVATYDPGSAASLLLIIGREWPYPYTDSSAVPTHAATVFAQSLGGPAVAEGTAGGLIAGAHIEAWKRQGRVVPRPLRRLAAQTIRSTGLWRYGGRLEKVFRVAGRTGLPPAASYLVKNALDGLAYDVPPSVLRQLGEAIVQPLAGLPGGPAGTASLALAALTVRSAGRYAPKVMGPLTLRGMSGLHPYMGQDVILAELSARGPWSTRQSKAILKSQLALQVPPDLVYRPKSAFTPRIEDVLAVGEVRAAIEEAIADGAPLLPFIQPAPIRLLLRRAADPSGPRGVVVGRPGRWLWTLAFAHLWLCQTKPGAAASAHADAPTAMLPADPPA